MTRRLPLAWIGVFLVLVGVGASARADVKLASIFGDSMVLQCDMAIPVWGWADPGEEVTVTLGDQTKSVKADDDGRWQVKLDALKANAEGQTLTVTGANTIELKDVLIGEVWICSGQSNMEWGLGGAMNGERGSRRGRPSHDSPV